MKSQTQCSVPGILVIPRIQVQNANIISSSLTWGFPSMTAFMGLMWAFERRLKGCYDGVIFDSVAVISHSFNPLVDEGYIKRFNLTRNPLTKTGQTSSFSEEGRANMEITLIFSVDGEVWKVDDLQRERIASKLSRIFHTMRVAGGSIVRIGNRWSKFEFRKFPDDAELRHKEFSRLKREWLPGMCLVQRQDCLDNMLKKMKSENPEASLVDAFLEFARLSWSADPGLEESSEKQDSEWKLSNKRDGWLVPIPVGYGAISELHEGGSVHNSRDTTTPFRFVESIYSLGEWVSPHRFSNIEQMLWFNDKSNVDGIYACKNSYSETISLH